MSEPPTPEQCDEWARATGLMWMVGRHRRMSASPTKVQSFAAIAAAWGYDQGVAAERERCAKICDEYSAERWTEYCRNGERENWDLLVHGEAKGGKLCADRIRALDPAQTEHKGE